MLKIQESSLDWALTHIERFGDTDIFPVPFEYEAIRFDWTDIKKYLRDQDILQWKVRAHRRCLTPKHRYGFRISTQLDPLDTIVFTSLVYEIGQDVETERIPTSDNVVFSYRFKPQADGKMFDPDINWEAFQNQCKAYVDSGTYTHVITADIADFYPRIYSHPLENALDYCTSKKNHIKMIQTMLKSWNFSVSYGIPVGPTATRLLAELTISDIDKGLINEGIVFCRYVDDFRIFCKSEIEAYKQLALVANMLFENHGLTLQQHKTRIINIKDFEKYYLKSEEALEVDNLSDKFYEILDSIGVENPYGELDYESFDPDTKKRIDELNLIDILIEQIESSDELDNRLVVFILKRLGQLNNIEAIDFILDNIDKLYTLFKHIITYINELTCISTNDKKNIADKLLKLLDNSIVGHLEYHRACVLNIFTKDEEWNHKDKFISLYSRYSDQFTRRKLILALGRSKNIPWFKSNKRGIEELSPWLKRAFLAAASCLPGDEAKHWYSSISRRLDPLEIAVTKWVTKNPFK